MKFGARFYGFEPSVLIAKAQLAEELGYESIWRGDHLILPVGMESSYPYSTPPGPPFDVDTPLLDVLVTLGFLAAATSTIRLATGVYILPLRDVYATARAVQTVDVLSQGRVIFGVGVGWLREEFEVVGRPFAERGSATDEGVEVLKRLWCDPEPSFEGRHYHLPPVRFEPKPVQRPHPPIVFGGESPAALERVARSGDGWYGHRQSPAEVEPIIARLDELRAVHGRDGLPFEVTIRVTEDVDLADIDRFADLGVARLVLECGSFADTEGRADLDLLDRFADRVVSRWQ
jgi:probable F420-dependent oxidoreductase